MNELPIAPKLCPACGKANKCGQGGTNGSTCWCADIPTKLPVQGSECYCKDCLEKVIAQLHNQPSPAVQAADQLAKKLGWDDPEHPAHKTTGVRE